ncbi:MAG: hemolysin III family protein [Acidimicrobiia bacterium]|nr:hemolysin III family protein [Acidimicrobiia bacterium]
MTAIEAPPEGLGFPAKPRLRGRLHQFTFFASIPAGVIIVLLARGASGYVAASLYAASVAALFGTSAAYHRGRWSPATRLRMQQADHAMIFVLIAGSYTPITLLALRPAWGITLLAMAWTVAVVGVTLTFTKWHFMDRHSGYLYVAFGWVMVVALPVIFEALSATQLVLLFAGGVFYTVGAIFFGLERPRLRPQTFGFHEMWHVMTVAAAGCHYALIVSLVHA